MGEIIEHRDSGNPPEIRVGEENSPVSVKVYQAIYHQVIGRTEQIRKGYSNNLLIDQEEVEQLHYKIMQLCDIYKIVARNETVSIFYEKERKEQFTSFDRFRTYNSNASSPTVNLVLKYNFSIIPSGIDKPQEYVVTIRLSSRVAMLNQLEDDARSFVRGRLFGFMVGNIADITIEYADYIVARGFLEAFDEWIKGCKSEPDAAWLQFLRSKSEYLPKATQLVAACLMIFFSLRAIPSILSSGSALPETWARFAILFGGGFYLILSFADIAGEMFENIIDSYMVISYLNLNKGDKKLIEDFGKRKSKALRKFIAACLFNIALGFVASQLAELI